MENRENLKEFCEVTLEIRFGQILDDIHELKKADKELFSRVLSLFEKIKEEGIKYLELSDEILWCADKNILFVNPIKKIVKSQSKLDYVAIRKVVEIMKV